MSLFPTRNTVLLLLATPLLALGCQAGISGEFSDDAGDDVLNIVGVQPDFDHPSVVALSVYGAGAFCSGVLIDEYTVLTSARCIVDVVYPWDIEVFFGDKVRRVWNGDGFSVPIWDFFLHPQYDPWTLENDIGLLYLYYPVTSIAPSPVDFDIFPEDIGADITYVGFRPNAYVGGSGPRNKADATLEDFNEDSLMYRWRGEPDDLPEEIPPFDPEEDCLLGAGSAAFIDRGGVEVVIGINSYSSADCESYGVNVRPRPVMDPGMDF